MTEPTTSPAVSEAMREAVARIIDPTAFECSPGTYGLPSEAHPRWRDTMAYGFQQVALQKADDVLARLSALVDELRAARGEAEAERDEIHEAFMRVAEVIGAPASERLDIEVRDHITRLRAEYAAVEARRAKIDIFGHALHCIDVGVPGIKPLVRDAIARNIAMRIRAALTKEPTHG